MSQKQVGAALRQGLRVWTDRSCAGQWLPSHRVWGRSGPPFFSHPALHYVYVASTCGIIFGHLLYGYVDVVDVQMLLHLPRSRTQLY